MINIMYNEITSGIATASSNPPTTAYRRLWAARQVRVQGSGLPLQHFRSAPKTFSETPVVSFLKASNMRASNYLRL